MRIKSAIEKNRKELCAIEIGDTGVAYARVYYPNTNKKPFLRECDFQPYPNNEQEQLRSCITTLVEKYNLKDIACNWVLLPQDYRLFLIDAPRVSPEEYKAAARWQIKDMVDYAMEDTALDVFTSPPFSNFEQQKIYAVAARSSLLRKTSAIISQTSLSLNAIDIQEFAIRNLLAPLAEQDRSVGFVHLEKNNCLLIIVKNEQIYFVRNIPLNAETLVQSSNIVKLASEIQRSLAYYSNELGQDKLTEFFTPPMANISTARSTLTDAIAQQNSLTIRTIPLGEIVNIEHTRSLSPEIQESCYRVIGGALRKD